MRLPRRIARSGVVALLLLAAPAYAEDEDDSSEEEAPSGDAESDAPSDPEAQPEAPEPEAPEPEAPEPEAEREPERALEPEFAFDPVSEEELELDDEPEPEAEEEDLLGRELDRAPWFSIQIGGAGTAILDTGAAMLGLDEGPANPLGGRRSGVGMLDRFHFGLDIYPHPHVAVSVAVANENDLQHTVTSEVDGSLTFATSVLSLDVAGKFILAPPFQILRPYARAGGGFFRVEIDLTAGDGNGNLATRHYRGPTPYAVLGGGLEIVSPRRKLKGAEADKADESPRLRWGVGFFIEGGVTLGSGGSDVDAAPTVDLGALGDLSLGPGYIRLGLVILL